MVISNSYVSLQEGTGYTPPNAMKPGLGMVSLGLPWFTTIIPKLALTLRDQLKPKHPPGQ